MNSGDEGFGDFGDLIWQLVGVSGILRQLMRRDGCLCSLSCISLAPFCSILPENDACIGMWICYKCHKGRGGGHSLPPVPRRGGTLSGSRRPTNPLKPPTPLSLDPFPEPSINNQPQSTKQTKVS